VIRQDHIDYRNGSRDESWAVEMRPQNRRSGGMMDGSQVASALALYY
jgi:hypothetical protein